MKAILDVDQLQQAGFPMGGESLVALDLVDTLLLVADPQIDLLADPDRAQRWWRLQAARLPAGPSPDLAATQRLRAALRDLFDAHLERRAPRTTSVEDVNAFAASVPVSVRMAGSGAQLHAETRWHTEHGGNAALAAIAGQAVGLMTDPARLASLRRCASPTCSMLFLADNKRRVWCTAAVCGNRARVARHYQRTHDAAARG